MHVRSIGQIEAGGSAIKLDDWVGAVRKGVLAQDRRAYGRSVFRQATRLVVSPSRSAACWVEIRSEVMVCLLRRALFCLITCLC